MIQVDQQALHVLVQLEGDSVRDGWALGLVPEVPTAGASFVLLNSGRVVKTSAVVFADLVSGPIPAVVFETETGSTYSLVALRDLVDAYKRDDLYAED
jgi:hypothetical protein